MIDQYKPRVDQDETFGIFDCPDGGQHEPKRNASTTPPGAESAQLRLIDRFERA